MLVDVFFVCVLSCFFVIFFFFACFVHDLCDLIKLHTLNWITMLFDKMPINDILAVF